jgi:predicted GNAT family N-acyltransferase
MMNLSTVPSLPPQAGDALLEPVIYLSPLYHKAVEVRYSVLRKPLGMVYTPEQLALDEPDEHIALTWQGEVLACLTFKRADISTVRLRQVAVAEHAQGRGIGTRLIQEAEAIARQKGYQTAFLHAREAAIPFYRKLGYEVVGEPFIEVTLPHLRMEKVL